MTVFYYKSNRILDGNQTRSLLLNSPSYFMHVTFVCCCSVLWRVLMNTFNTVLPSELLTCNDLKPAWFLWALTPWSCLEATDGGQPQVLDCHIQQARYRPVCGCFLSRLRVSQLDGVQNVLSEQSLKVSKKVSLQQFQLLIIRCVSVFASLASSLWEIPQTWGNHSWHEHQRALCSISFLQLSVKILSCLHHG